VCMMAGEGRWLLLEKEQEIRALVDGRKTQKREVITSKCCSYGQPADLLWVKEPYWQERRNTGVVVYEATPEYYRDADGVIHYEPDEGRLDALKHHKCWQWVRALFMPEWASRLTLEIIAVRTGWLQAISEADARAEGFAGVSEYRRYWERRMCLWDQNLRVWIVTFIVHQRSVVEMEVSAERNHRNRAKIT
jgi:hypothetical protein